MRAGFAGFQVMETDLAEVLFPHVLGPAVVAFVGGGGKTSLMFALARQLAASRGLRVLCTTTTKMLPPVAPRDSDAVVSTDDLDDALGQVALAMHSSSDGAGFGGGGGRVVALVGAKRDQGGVRACGVSAAWIPQFLRAADRGCCDVVLVEADGSRRRPLKAPAPHEPVLPAGLTHAVAVCGIDALGAVLDEDDGAVFRVPEVAAVTGLALGSVLTAEALAACIAQRGVWGVPAAGVVFACCVNKCDDEPRAARAREVARCAERYAPDLFIVAGQAERGRGLVWPNR